MAINTAKKGASTTQKGAKQEDVEVVIINSWTMKEFAAEFNIIKASKVRLNTNKYPFITFLQEAKDDQGRNIAENIYFSKKAGELVELDDEPTVCKELGLVVLELEYPDGETRLKLSLEGDGGDYTNIKDLF